MPTEDTSKLQFADVLAQGLSGSFKLLSSDELATARQNFVLITGDEPGPAERPSDEQLSALKAWLEAKPGGRMKAPYADFAIFGPYGKRSLKARHFVTRALGAGGEWRVKRLRGPSTFTDWKASWAVFHNALLMLGAASPAALNSYFKGLETLLTRFPSAWPEIATADELVRSEQWDLLLEEGLAAGTRTQGPQVWSSIIRDSAYGGFQGPRAQWWDDHLTFTLMATGRANASHTDVLESPATPPLTLDVPPAKFLQPAVKQRLSRPPPPGIRGASPARNQLAGTAATRAITGGPAFNQRSRSLRRPRRPGRTKAKGRARTRTAQPPMPWTFGRVEGRRKGPPGRAPPSPLGEGLRGAVGLGHPPF